jgi:hypothetical protein
MGHGTRAVVIVGGDGHESVNVRGHSSSGVMDGQLRASLVELKPEGLELPSSFAPTGLPPSTPANRTAQVCRSRRSSRPLHQLLMDHQIGAPAGSPGESGEYEIACPQSAPCH